MLGLEDEGNCGGARLSLVEIGYSRTQWCVGRLRFWVLERGCLYESHSHMTTRSNPTSRIV